MSNLSYRNLHPSDFAAVIELGNRVHGDGYIDLPQLQQFFELGHLKDINASFVVYDDDKLVGFRLTFAPGNWQLDEWCSPDLWQVPVEQVCYFKCNTVDENYQGLGIGGRLLTLSIDALKKQGASAGVSHLWRQSPGNAAVKYFSKCGGELIKDHPDRWNALSKSGYNCVICGHDCHCVAAEMIIRF